jgi:predicted acylesterase/phospholipase RssA
MRKASTGRRAHPSPSATLARGRAHRMGAAAAKRKLLPAHCAQLGLVLQGGGALGTYQAGVYQALAEHGYLPHWIAGISIGAIKGAIIAGCPENERVQRLRAFWERISEGVAFSR